MDCPGMSLFQGAGSININNSDQARLEEEHFEDQKRRNEELKHELENAFDDLIEEDDVSSVNSSSNFPSNTLIPPDNSIKQSGEYDQNITADPKVHTPKNTANIQEIDEKSGDRPIAFRSHPVNQYENVFTPLIYGKHAMGMGDIIPGFQNNPHFIYDNPHHVKREYNGGDEAVTNGHSRNEIYIEYNNLLMMHQRVVAELEEMRAVQTSTAGRLAIAKSEREQLELSLQQAHQLLVESKQRLMQMEEDMKAYNQTKLELNTRVDELTTELTAAMASLADCQHRLQASKLNAHNNTDHLFKMQQERHKDEIERLHEDLEKTRNRLAEKSKEALEAERRAKDSEKEKEDLLIDKGVTINRLAAELEQAQIQLNQAKQDRNTARKQVKELGSKLEGTALELSAARKERLTVECALDGTLAAFSTSGSVVTSTPTAVKDKVDTVKKELVKCLNCLRQKEEHINKLGLAVKEKEQQIHRQKKELEDLTNELDTVKANNVKHKNEVKILQQRLELLISNSRTELLDGYKLKNEELEDELSNLRKELKLVQLQHCEVEMELSKARSEKTKRKSLEKEANSNLLAELSSLTTQLGEARKESQHFRALYIEMCAAKEQMLAEMIKLKNGDAFRQLEEEKEKVDDLRVKLNDQKEMTDNLKETIRQYEHKIIRMQNDAKVERTDSPCQTDTEAEKMVINAGAQTESGQEDGSRHSNNDKGIIIENLNRDLNSKNKIIEDLQDRIAFQTEKNKLVGELHSKAKQFEAYIVQHYVRLADKRDASTEVDFETVKVQKSTATNTELLDELSAEYSSKFTEGAKTEKDIRQEIAKQFALELKSLDTLYKNKVANVEQQNKDNFVQLKQMAESKAMEVHSLETLIIAERKKTKELLTNKENELLISLKQYDVLLSEVNVLKEKLSDCDYFKEEVERYKLKLQKVKKEVTERRKKLSQEKEKNQKMERELRLWQSRRSEALSNESQLEALKEKYKSVKKMALNYKEYANLKDHHVKSELDRIKANYDSAVSRLQAKLDAVISTQEKQVNQRIYNMESDFEQKLAEFSNDIR